MVLPTDDIQNSEFPHEPYFIQQQNWSPPKIKFCIRLLTENPIDITILSEYSSVPIETIEKIINGTYETEESTSFLELTNITDRLSEKIVIGLLKYKYQNQIELFNMLKKTEDDLRINYEPYNMFVNMFVNTISMQDNINYDLPLSKLESLKNIILLIKELEIKEPFNIDEFSLEFKRIYTDPPTDSIFPKVPLLNDGFLNVCYTAFSVKFLSNVQIMLNIVGLRIINLNQNQNSGVIKVF